MKKTNCCYRFEPKEYLLIKDQLNKQFDWKGEVKK